MRGRSWFAAGVACLSCTFGSSGGDGSLPPPAMTSGADTTTGTVAESESIDDTGDGMPSGTESGDGPPGADPWAACHRLSFNAPPPAPGLPEVPVLLRLDPSRIDYDLVAPGGADLRPLAGDSHLEMPYEIERWSPGGESLVWTRVPAVSDDPNHFWLCYGRPGLVDAQQPALLWGGYTAVWHATFEAGAPPPQLPDATGHGLGATLSPSAAAPAATEGFIAGGLRLAGAGHYAQVTRVGPITSGTAVSLEGWVRPDEFATPGGLAYLLRKDNQFDLVAQRVGSNAAAFGVFVGISARLWVDSPAPVPTDGWHHLVGTWHRDEAVARLYLDGSPWAEFPYAGTEGTPLYTSADPLFLGLDLQAAIDELRIAPVQLSPESIAIQYRSMKDVLLTYGPAQELE